MSRQTIIETAADTEITWQQAAAKFKLPNRTKHALKTVATSAVKLGDLEAIPAHWQ